MMKSIFLKVALGATLAAGSAPVFADLIYVNTSTQNSGTGLGAVSTVVTIQDNDTFAGLAANNPAGSQSGCVTFNPDKPNQPSTACTGTTLTGGDNTSGAGGNNTYFLNDLKNIEGLQNAGQLGFVVNISEGGPGGTATLTDLFLSLYRTDLEQTQFHFYTGADLVLGDTGGVGQSGTHRFILSPAQALQAIGFCPVLSQCVVGGGFQFLGGTTSATPETMYVGAFARDPDFPSNEISEPGSIALLGAGTMALGFLRRRYAAKR